MALIIHEVKKGHWPGGMWLFMHLSWGSDAMDLAQRGTKGGCCCCMVCPQETTHGSGRSQKRYQAQTKQQLLVLCSQAFLLTYLLSPPA